MDRVVIFVDAGYLFAQGSLLIAGMKLKRSETVLQEEKALDFLKQLAAQVSGLPLLRIYWYDGTDAGPTPVHRSLAYRADVKVRLGIVNAFGEQKGVDSLIVSDLIDLSRNRAMSDAVVLTGDEDLRVSVQKAQEMGVRVHLVGLEPAQNNQSNLLRQEADTLHEVSKAEVQTFLTRTVPSSVPAVPLAAPVSTTPGATRSLALEAAAELFAKTLTMPDVERVKSGAGSVPRDIDSALLRAVAAAGGSLSFDEKRALRRRFIDVCKAMP